MAVLMGSASRRLYEAGLVENAKAFDNYLCNNGYSRSINPGTYEIAPGISEEEIQEAILHASVYCGFPRALNATFAAQEAIESRRNCDR